MTATKTGILAGVTTVLLLLVLRPAPAAEPAAGMRVEPGEIQVRAFFRGSRVAVEAEVPAAEDYVVLLLDEPRPIELKKKGKVWGVLWMKVGEVCFEKVPAVYKLTASRPPEKLASAEVLGRLGVGYAALRAENVGPDDDTGECFDELVRLKESEGMYGAVAGKLEMSPGEDGMTRVRAELSLPAKVPTGSYEVRLYGFTGGEGKLQATGGFTVRHAGAVAFIYNLARDHGLLYGVLSVVIALVVGFSTGLVFNLGSRGGH